MSVVIEFDDEEFDFLMGELYLRIKQIDTLQSMNLTISSEEKDELKRLTELYNELERQSDL